ncbi:MAG TPA: ABC transporter permease [Mycobacteriales bacterium]|nr:ABC transporter permease [Mycobacteriales bacterium]
MSLAAQLPRTAGARLSRRYAVGGLYVILGLLSLLAFGIGTDSGKDARFGLALEGARLSMPDLVLPARVTAIVLSLLVAALGVLRVVRAESARLASWLTGLVIVSLLAAFLCWSVAGQEVSLVGIVQGTVFLSIPLVLGALSGVLCERAGVINISIEGQFLLGAFTAAFAGTVTGSLWVGLICGCLAGGLLGLLLAVFAIRYLVDQVILGVVLNVFALGLTGFLYDRVLQPNAESYNSPGIFNTIKIPLLADIPVLGPVLFDSNIFLYLTYVLLAVVHIGLFHTRWGLRVRAVGEHPTAADTVGIRVLATRYRNVLYGGLVAGLGGAFFTIGSVGAFGKNMTSGKGFIALAALIFGRWSPFGSLAAALVFGFADQIQLVLTSIGTTIPSQFMLMAPYLATIFAVAGLVGKVRAPKADGKPYVKS